MARTAAVGGRLEELPPPAHSTEPTDVGRVLLLMLLSFLLHAALYANTYTTARDSIGFAQLALQYESPQDAIVRLPSRSVLDIARYGEPPHPPGYPLLVLAVSKFVRKSHEGPLADAMLRSAQLTSMLGAILLVAPLYGLVRSLFDRRAAMAAGLIFTALPVFARVSSDGLTEAWYLLCAMHALRAAGQAWMRAEIGTAFQAGLWIGAAYWIRPEGLLLGPACGVLWLLGVLCQRGSGFGLRTTQFLMMAGGALLVAGPYMWLIGGMTLKPNSAEILPELGQAAHNPLLPAQAELWAAHFNPEYDSDRAAWLAKTLLRETAKTCHYSMLVFGLIGAGCALRLVHQRPELALPGAVLLVNIAVILVFSSRSGYLSERHTLLMTLMLTIYAGHGIFQTADWFVRNTPRLCPLGDATGWIYVVIILGSCLPAALKPLHQNRYGHKVIGEYLKEHAGPRDVIIDPYTWALYYSGRSLRGVPPDDPQAEFRWAILEVGETPHSTLTRLEAAQNVANDRDNPATLHLEWQDPTDIRDARRIILVRQPIPKTPVRP